MVAMSNFTDDAILTKHAEFTVDDIKFEYPVNKEVFKKEIVFC